MNVVDFVRETNRIEGIHREPTQEEIDEFKRFVRLETITVAELEKFVSIYQPDARLRDLPGLDVCVGGHIPPRGGPHVVEQLKALLDEANEKAWTDKDAWRLHVQYETLHPFTDGNGRSGRMLWAWMTGELRAIDLGFLHRFYYQTLDQGQRRQQ